MWSGELGGRIVRRKSKRRRESKRFAHLLVQNASTRGEKLRGFLLGRIALAGGFRAASEGELAALRVATEPALRQGPRRAFFENQ